MTLSQSWSYTVHTSTYSYTSNICSLNGKWIEHKLRVIIQQIQVHGIKNSYTCPSTDILISGSLDNTIYPFSNWFTATCKCMAWQKMHGMTNEPFNFTIRDNWLICCFLLVIAVKSFIVLDTWSLSPWSTCKLLLSGKYSSYIIFRFTAPTTSIIGLSGVKNFNRGSILKVSLMHQTVHYIANVYWEFCQSSKEHSSYTAKPQLCINMYTLAT